MGVIALIVLLCIVGGITGVKLANQESMDAEAWGLIGTWALLAAGVVLLLVRRSREERGESTPSGDG